MVWTVISYLQRKLVWTIPIAMAAGFGLGVATDPGPLRPLILPVTILMIYPIMVTLDVRSLVARCRWRLLVLVQVLNLVLFPALGWGLGRLFFPDEPLRAFGLLLMATLPTSGMTISWTRFAGGNVAAAVKMTVLGLLLGSVLLPFYATVLMGQSVSLDLAATIRKILLVVFVPLVAGVATQVLLRRMHGHEHFRTFLKPRLPALSSLAVLAIIVIAVALRARAILAHPVHLLELLPPLLVFYAVSYLAATVIGRRLLPRSDAVVLVFGTVMRNLSVALALAMTVLGSRGAESALVVAVAYVIQVQSAAWYVGRADRLLGISHEEARGT